MTHEVGLSQGARDSTPPLFEDSQLDMLEYSQLQDSFEDSQLEDYDSNPEDEIEATSVPHSLVFKCIGCNKSPDYQSALRVARDKLSNDINVPVKLIHEPTNPRDARALTFVCEIDGKYHTIGYVVSELLEEVHAAIKEKKIISVKFSWVRYITEWSHSGPGFFAGIEIRKKGPWSLTAIGSASTK